MKIICRKKMTVQVCEECGHLLKDHWCDVNNKINCQTCERQGHACDIDTLEEGHDND